MGYAQGSVWRNGMEWIIYTVQTMHDKVQLKVRVGSSYSDPIDVSVGMFTRDLC